MANKNFIVGLFVGIALLVFVGTSIWLTGKKGTEPTVFYSMLFKRDVGGLMLGGPVFYLGVEVGTVTAMVIMPGNPMQVRVDVEVLASTPVDSGTFASLAMQGITGVAVIKMSGDPGVHGPLHEKQGQLYPVIEVRDAGFSAVLSKAPAIVDKLDSVLVQINQILGEENRLFVRDMLKDFSTVSSALASRQDVISDIPVSLDRAINELHASLLKVKSMAGKLEPDLSSAVANLNLTTANLAAMTERLAGWTEANDGEMNAFMGDGLGQVPELVSELRSTVREIEKLVQELREDPSKLVYKPVEETVNVEQ